MGAHNGYFDHISKDGRTPQDRVTGLIVTGENIAKGQSTVQDVVDEWLQSDEHCLNIMSPDHTLIGVGYFAELYPSNKHFWTQMFADSGFNDRACLPGYVPPLPPSLSNGNSGAVNQGGSAANGGGNDNYDWRGKYKFDVQPTRLV